MPFNYIESFSSSYVSNLSQQEIARDLYKRALAFDLERANENQKQEILGYLNQAIELDPTFPGAYIARGSLNTVTEQKNNFNLEDNSRREEIILDFSKAIELDPNFSDEHFPMGTAQFLRGILRLINTTTALQNGKVPSYDELDQIAADLEVALSHDFEIAQSALESVSQLKDLLDKLNLLK